MGRNHGERAGEIVIKISHGSSDVFSLEAVWKYTIEQESAEVQRTKTIDSASGVSAVPTGLGLSPTLFPALKCRAIFTASRWDARTGTRWNARTRMERRFPAPRQGQHENSPALQCRGRDNHSFLRSPVGTAETSGVSAVPTGLWQSPTSFPALKCRAIFTASRWDARTGMVSPSLAQPHPLRG